MMNIVLNGNKHTLDGEHNIQGLLERHGYNGKLIAVAVNNEFLPKTDYSKRIIRDNDRIEIVAPMQGG